MLDDVHKTPLLRGVVYIKRLWPGAGVLQLGPQVGLGFPHALASLGHGGPDVTPQGPQRAGQVGRDPLRRVALDRLPHEPHEPERRTEAEPDSDDQPEESFEHRPYILARRKRRKARPVPAPKAKTLTTGLDRARYSSRDAESTVTEIDSAVPSRPSTRSSSTLAWLTVPCRLATTGSVSRRMSSTASRIDRMVRVSVV